MLQSLRDKSSGWVATVILGLLIVPFALFGVNDYISGGSQNYAARIQSPPTWWRSAPAVWPASVLWRHQDIGAGEFRERFEQERQRARQAEGAAFDNKAFESAENKRKVLEQLIDERLMRMAAEDAGIRIPDATVRREIESVADFQVDGRFNARRYQALLAGLNPPMTPLRFEQRMRDDLQRNALVGQLFQTAFVTDADVRRLVGMWFEERDIDAAQVPAVAANQAVTDAEAKAWYDANEARYRTAETATIEYIDIDAAKLVQAPIDEAQLRATYAAQMDKFGTPEQRLVSHILIPVDAKADAAAQRAAQDKARQLAAQAAAPGTDFAALAKAQSGDPGSRNTGGDLGWIEQGGSLPKPFVDAVFALRKGAVSQPVKSDFGWHVIQLRDVRPGTRKTFEEVRAQLAEEAATGTRERTYNDLLGALVDELMKNPSGFAQVASKHQLPVQRLGPFPRNGGDGIAAVAGVQTEAFSTARIEDGSVSDPIEVGNDRSVLLRVVGYAPSKVQPLASVRAQVDADLRADKASRQAATTAKALAEAVRKGKPLATLASERGYPLQALPGLMRTATTPTPQAVKAVFSAPKPTEGAPSAGQILLPDGSWMVFQVMAVRPADVSAIPGDQQTRMRNELGVASGDQDAKAYVADMRKRVKIRVLESQL